MTATIQSDLGRQQKRDKRPLIRVPPPTVSFCGLQGLVSSSQLRGLGSQLHRDPLIPMGAPSPPKAGCLSALSGRLPGHPAKLPLCHAGPHPEASPTLHLPPCNPPILSLRTLFASCCLFVSGLVMGEGKRKACVSLDS